MKAMRRGMGALRPTFEILEGDAAFGRHAQPARRLEIDAGMRLGVLDVVARGHRAEALAQAGAAEMVFGRVASGGRGDGQRQAAAGEEIQQFDNTRFQRDAGLQQAARVAGIVLAKPST